ncbi:hypothetical protein [Candidatus Viridilinea mediisalina]|uniref:Uncharacterized protein n=1 Tax=Candidatus Viridilinea mediisalina TaxID=2024553 RepID=A0A2A6RPG4_9CHLR|nr:hypothetical protein [Candidatus Viridilinea mediisalina]PDW04942.1 hypothetical protein CJ255_00760 [Candidatus Viridilinea mediisalina]
MSESQGSFFNQQLSNALDTLIASNPFLVQMRALMRQLQDEREHLPVLLPLLLILFIVVYRRERAQIERLRRFSL